MGAIVGETVEGGSGGALQSQSQSQSQPRQPASQVGARAITNDQYLLWKRRKDAEAAARTEEAARKRAEDVVAGRVPMNGRELYQHEPWVFDDGRFV